MKKTVVTFLFINVVIIMATMFFIVFYSKSVAGPQQTEMHHWSSIGIATEEQKRTKSPNQFIQVNEEYKPNITIKNYYPEANLFRVFFLLDYKQVEVLYKGQHKSYIDIILKSNSEEIFQIDFPNMKEGLHDIVAIAVIEPDIPINEKKLSPGLSILMKRTPLIVGNKSIPSISYVETDKVSTVNSGQLFVSNHPTVNRQSSLSLIPSKDGATENIHTSYEGSFYSCHNDFLESIYKAFRNFSPEAKHWNDS